MDGGACMQVCSSFMMSVLRIIHHECADSYRFVKLQCMRARMAIIGMQSHRTRPRYIFSDHLHASNNAMSNRLRFQRIGLREIGIESHAHARARMYVAVSIVHHSVSSRRWKRTTTTGRSLLAWVRCPSSCLTIVFILQDGEAYTIRY